jgi:hypothetical protein
VTGDSYSLVERQNHPIANNLAFIEYDLTIINADHGPELVIDELLPAVFDDFRELVIQGLFRALLRVDKRR